MSRPYPEDIERGTLDEELYDINKAIEALSRLRGSNAFDASFDIESVQSKLDSSREDLKGRREKNATLTACREAFVAYAVEQDMEQEKAADELLDIIHGDSVSEKVSIIDRIEAHLPKYQKNRYDEDELLDILEELLNDPTEW